MDEKQKIAAKIIAKENVEKLVDSILKNGVALVHLNEAGDVEIVEPTEQFVTADTEGIH